jgi:hypothetical protein
VLAGAGRWWRAADLAVLAALVAVGSLLLVPAYGSGAPVVAAAVGAAVPAIVFAGLDRWSPRTSWPWWAAVPLIPCGVLVLGALVVAPQDRVLTFLPSSDAIAAVVLGSVDGWRGLLTVATPTGVTGGLLVPPLLIAAAGATVAGALLRTPRPALALSGPAASAVAFALFGAVTADPWIVVLVAGALLVAGLGWVAWIGGRAARRAERAAAAQLARDRVAGADGALGLRRTLVAGSILTAAAVVAALVATGGTTERVALREVVRAPVDPAAFESPLARFRTYTKDHPDDVQLVVQGLPTGARLRLAALDDYDGRQFRLSDAEGSFVRIGPERPAAANSASVQVNVTVQDYAGSFLPLPGSIVGLDFQGARADELTADLRYSAGSSTGVLPGGWRPGDAYQVVAGVPAQPSAAQLAAARPTPVTMPTGITVPDLLRSATDRYISEATTPAAQVEAIRAGLAADGFFSHGGAGEPTSPAGHGLDRLIGMVGRGSMVGDQEQYAALMAVLVRSLGIPARVVVGFAPTGSTEVAVQLRGRDITAWVEVPFDGFGWVAFDPTPSPDKPLTDDQKQTQTERREVAVEEPPALPQVQPDTVDTDTTDQGPQESTPPAPNEADTFMPALLLAMFGWTLLVLALFAAPIVTILAIKSRRRRRRLAALRPADRITGGWQQLVDTAVDFGYRPATWHTRSEVAHDLAGAGVLQMDWLAPAADAAQFSPTPVDDERARSYWREVDDRSAELLGGLGFWRRWRARLSLASLRRRAD